ncbi:ciliary-associated calcium-binding coiled-coil protein 1 [Tautogolabrus adspersus]
MNHRLCLKEASLLDFYIGGFSWMKQMKFSDRQMSFVVTLLHLMISNIREKQMDLVENLMVFIESLAHQCSTSGEETSVLNREEVFALIGYLKNSLFQKYKIYQYLFRTNRDELLTGSQRDVEVFGCQSICPLEEGLCSTVSPEAAVMSLPYK